MRERALRRFRSGSRPLLVATDVASRGLDVAEVDYVINYAFPLSLEDYVHRVGRTGRAGRPGVAYTFFSKDDAKLAGGLVDLLQRAGQTVPEEMGRFNWVSRGKVHSLYGSVVAKDTGARPKHTRFE